MAFTSASFSLVAYSGNGFHLWHYKSADTAADIDTAGYFNNVSSEVNVGDIIMAHVDTGGTAAFGMFVVNSNASGVVDVANITAIGGTDSD